MQNFHRSIYKNLSCRCFPMSMSPYLSTAYKLPSSPPRFMAWQLEISVPWQGGASRNDCRGHQNCHSKGPCLIYTRTEGWALGYLPIQLCPISGGGKVTLHKGNAVCLIQAHLTLSTSPFSACFCVKQMFYRGLGCVCSASRLLGQAQQSW